MYEEMTFEYIMSQMMEEMPDGIDTSEGSLIYHACAKQAARLEEAYINISQTADNLYPDTADLDHLILFGQEMGVYIEEATAAVFKGKFNVAVDIGNEFSGDDYNYIVTELIDDVEHTYKLECEEAGSGPNGWLGELMALDDIEGLETAELVSLLVEGEEEESEESYRMRLMDSFEIKPFAGNRAYYIQEIGSMDGVGAVKVYRNQGDGTISAVIMSDSFSKPTEEFVESVQNKVDPGNGDGEGIAPIGHIVIVSAVAEQTINIAAEIEYAEGYTYEALKTKIEYAVDNYLLELRKQWEDDVSIVIRIAGVENAIYDIDGILDVTNLKLNNAAQNITLEQNTVPTRGDVICS